MSQETETNADLARLKAQLRETLDLDLEDYGLDEPEDGEFVSTFLGLQLNSAFQPIYDSEAGELFGHEALLRPSLGGLQAISPDFAFQFAEQSERLVKFDRVSRTLHVLNFRQIFEENSLLFLKVHASLLLSVKNAHGKVFERILHAHSLPTERVVIEIHEGAIAQDDSEHNQALHEAVDNYRERGYRLAMDNFGRQHFNLDRLWKLTPDFVKLDRSLIHEAESNAVARKILPGLIGIIRDLGAQPVVTGIQNQAQLDIAIAAGGTLLQGYLLGKPAIARELQLNKSLKSVVKTSPRTSLQPNLRVAA